MCDLKQWINRNEAVALGISASYLSDQAKDGCIRRKRMPNGVLNVWLYAKEDVLEAIANKGKREPNSQPKHYVGHDLDIVMAKIIRSKTNAVDCISDNLPEIKRDCIQTNIKEPIP